MSRSASEPLRALTEEETKELQRVSRASSETRIRHQRAVALLAVSEGKSLSEAARLVGWKGHDPVTKVTRRFNSMGMSALDDLPRAVYKRVELCYTAGMKAYSQDLRQRVVRAVDAGQNQAEIAKTFAVSVATIKRYLKQRRETGHVLPKAIPGRPATKGAVLQAHLRAQLEAHPDATREEHCRLFQAEHGIEVSTASISRARAALGWTRKKRRSLPGNKMKGPGQPGASKPAS